MQARRRTSESQETEQCEQPGVAPGGGGVRGPARNYRAYFLKRGNSIPTHGPDKAPIRLTWQCSYWRLISHHGTAALGRHGQNRTLVNFPFRCFPPCIRHCFLQINTIDLIKVKKSKAIPVTGRRGLWGCEVLRIPHSLDSRLTDGGKVVSPTHPPHFTSQKHYNFYVSGGHFC
jgi:hypothetical protein